MIIIMHTSREIRRCTISKLYPYKRSYNCTFTAIFVNTPTVRAAEMVPTAAAALLLDSMPSGFS